MLQQIKEHIPKHRHVVLSFSQHVTSTRPQVALQETMRTALETTVLVKLTMLDILRVKHNQIVVGHCIFVGTHEVKRHTLKPQRVTCWLQMYTQSTFRHQNKGYAARRVSREACR